MARGYVVLGLSHSRGLFLSFNGYVVDVYKGTQSKWFSTLLSSVCPFICVRSQSGHAKRATVTVNIPKNPYG